MEGCVCACGTLSNCGVVSGTLWYLVLLLRRCLRYIVVLCANLWHLVEALRGCLWHLASTCGALWYPVVLVVWALLCCTCVVIVESCAIFWGPCGGACDTLRHFVVALVVPCGTVVVPRDTAWHSCGSACGALRCHGGAACGTLWYCSCGAQWYRFGTVVAEIVARG